MSVILVSSPSNTNHTNCDRYLVSNKCFKFPLARIQFDISRYSVTYLLTATQPYDAIAEYFCFADNSHPVYRKLQYQNPQYLKQSHPSQTFEVCI